ncbi:hypothetical protein LTR66_006499 [Elasticomyces elasticus]|nr:hypothetical protein LTR50_007087 [Elasticomyces elasticus]KAK4991598.1 hypothetical protein LTR66_006499 [Elasticomyces elasticus]
MLSRHLKRACLDARWTLPPTFLLPFTANLTTVSHSAEPSDIPEVLSHPALNPSYEKSTKIPLRKLQRSSQPPSPSADDAPVSPSSPSPQSSSSKPRPPRSPLVLSDSVRELLPLLQAQGSHYITAHIYDRPYLLTAGDTVRLPFLMHGVRPGDVLRLDKASNLGSRDYTLKAAAAPPSLRSATTATTPGLDPTTGHLSSESRVMPEPADADSRARTPGQAPHFIPHIAKFKHAYLDDRLFVCRAVVMGVEAEPMRIKEKTKRRNRRVKKVKSKHRFTILRIKEVTVRSLAEIERLRARKGEIASADLRQVWRRAWNSE